MSAISEATRHRVSDIHDHGVDTVNFIIYVQGIEENPYDDYVCSGVDYRMANRLIKNLDILNGIDKNQPIIISMKSDGGDWAEGMAMYDAILATSNPVTILNYAEATSMSSIILQAANKRVMLPHSSFMYHEGSTFLGGTIKQVRSSTEFNKNGDLQMLQIYEDCLKRSDGEASKWSRKRIREHVLGEMNNKEEVYLTAAEAVKIGFADEVFTDWDSLVSYTEEQLARK